VMHLSDEDITQHVLADLELHLGVQFSPRGVRVSRWPGAFAQYRPHHARWVDDVEALLPAGLFLAGASYRGIGIPACIRQARTIAEHATQHLIRLAE
jgi:oxygen-dependent protoporphyrinogen oxidase